MVLHHANNAAAVCKNKIIIMSLACILLLIIPARHYAQTFADEQMLNRLNQKFSVQARQRGIALNALLKRLKKSNVRQQLIEVNRFFNQFKYKEDMILWGEMDYWTTPEEFLGVNGGDCEDYVIAKYFALRSLGVPDEQLYLTYVKAIRQNIAHMVLSFFPTPQSIPLILDNYNPQILSADKRRDLLPVYSFNAKSLFLSNASAGMGRFLPTDKIKNSKWKELLANIKRSKQ